MKKINAFFFLLICLAISNQVFGQKTLTESFDYSTGSIIGQGTATNGWNGAWTEGVTTAAGGILNAIEGNFGNDVGKTGELKQNPEYSGSNTTFRVTRTLASDFYFVDNVPGQEIWISFYFKNDIKSALSNSQSYLQLSQPGYFSCPPIGSVANSTTTPGKLGMHVTKTVANTSEADLNYILVKFVLDGAGVTDGDLAYMWVNYAGGTAPDISTAQTSRTFTIGSSTRTAEISTVNLLTYKNRVAYFDKIRISNTFAQGLTTGISSIVANQKIYKSGANQLTVDLDNMKGAYNLCVLDMSGRQLIQHHFTANGKMTLNTNLETGMYIVKVTNAEKTITSKIKF